MSKILAFLKLIQTSQRKRIIAAAFLLLLIFTLLFLWLKERKEEIHPKSGPIVELVYSLGTVKSDRVYHLKLGVTSSIRKLFVKEGEVVSEGQQLLYADTGTLFKAPFSGTVTTLPYQEGEVVMPGTPILTIMDLKKTYILLSLDQDSMLRIRPGQKAELSFETIRGNKLTGKVHRVYPSDGQFYVMIDVDAMPEGVLPEMTADVAVEVARKEKALLIPVKAVEKGRIHIKRDGHSIWVDAKVGAVDGEWCEVLEDSILPTDTILLARE
ncbi:HlyD family efflux transporter periplasmic adaptor subunit [Leptospira langatensis]|uniref:HlyD family efflux transporter periplasmic adaptor subunit n=1 Tax=Leptospira langatensis TaxID=2484983 RepID=A0A5F1ZXS7_9LEPT|nr:HlyD family efflux transporter periplasmic adaptor subunit [Leptospira langatensis]TGK04185.1 HlyD family efflux transporter periplasmic adaptor subunit [Leptospira langatensis]TGL43665.1 HlyD family efflux transporter periplasmic adaptor subunit [Leptospira langatensis]